ncbi:MAG: FtsQ-type POTRA domain-containing protein [Brevundimonas sp.]|nr:FtsQ-type POTRA domain-containing protein [Brevundimonas sp.]
MPAVVRGGRRQSSKQPAKRGAAPQSQGRGRAPRNAPGTPGKLAALGRLDLSPRAVMVAIAAGALLLAGVLATGARAERIGASIGQGVDGMTAGLGLKLEKVFIEGESPEATRAIQQAVQLSADQPMTAIDLDAVRRRVEAIGWVKSARIVRLLPNTLIVHVIEHDRLAVWQTGGVNQVIDSHGQVIAGAEAGRYPNLPLVVGKGAEQAASEVLPLIAQRPRLASRVSTGSFSGMRASKASPPDNGSGMGSETAISRGVSGWTSPYSVACRSPGVQLTISSSWSEFATP